VAPIGAKFPGQAGNCAAISARDHPKRAAILKKHIARIDDPRLRRTFQAAVDLEQGSAPAACKKKGQDVWAGLRR
jgi:phosphoenolpyruvate-protein kinase (PTS system EI component)